MQHDVGPVEARRWEERVLSVSLALAERRRQDMARLYGDPAPETAHYLEGFRRRLDRLRAELGRAEAERRETILVADGRDAIRRLVCTTLEGGGHRLVEATGGDEAWQIALEQRPAVALLDAELRRGDGLGVATAIRAEPGLAGMRVIVLRTHRPGSEPGAGPAAEADLYVPIPFSPLELVGLVEKALGEAAG
jgi:CheY-like chemotaxis protein